MKTLTSTKLTFRNNNNKILGQIACQLNSNATFEKINNKSFLKKQLKLACHNVIFIFCYTIDFYLCDDEIISSLFP